MENHILIGLGGTGGKILKKFRERLFDEYTNEENRSRLPVSYIYVDSDDLLMKNKWNDTGVDCSIDKKGHVYIKNVEFQSIKENIKNEDIINPWFGDLTDWDELQSLRADQGAAQLRRLGRVYLAKNIEGFNTALSNSITYCNSRSRSIETTIHIIAGLSGGTGSGTLIDILAQQINYFPKITDATILVYGVLPEKNPEPPGKTNPGYYYANAYACLTELNKIALGHPEAGKGYRPFDISGRSIAGDMRITPRFKSCYLFQDVNEKGKNVSIKEDLPQIISDYIFQFIFRLTDVNAREAIQKLTENSADSVEMDKFSGASERAFDFASAGIKRLEIPEQDIMEYFSYDISLQAFYQLKFNNWHKGQGYKNEKKEDLMHELKKFSMLTLESLSLLSPVQIEDIKQNFLQAEQEWNNRGTRHLDNAIKRISQTDKESGNSIDVLAGYYSYHFTDTFRNDGVRAYWANKTQNIDTITNVFFDKIQDLLFDLWLGDPSNPLSAISFTGVKYLIDKIKEKLAEIAQKANDEIAKYDNDKFDTNTAQYSIRGCDQEIAKLKREIANRLRFTSDKKLITQADFFLLNKYKYLTKKEAYTFATALITNLNRKLDTLAENVNGLVEKLDIAIEKLNKELIPKSNWVVDHKTSIKKDADIEKLHDVAKIADLSRELLNDDSIYPGEMYNIRRIIQNKAYTNKDFRVLNDEINADFLLGEFFYLVKSGIINLQNRLINNNLVLNENKKLIGNNIFRYLKKHYPSDDKLSDLFMSLMDSAGVYMQYSNKEHPLNRPKQNTTVWVVTMPLFEEEAYVEKVKNIIRGHIGDDTNFVINDKSNEIVFLKVAQSIPLRIFKLLEEKLWPEYLHATVDKQLSDKSKVVLHTEGTTEDYPALLPLNDSQRQSAIDAHFDKIMLPYLLTGLSIDLIKKHDDKYYLAKNVPVLLSNEPVKLYQLKSHIYPDTLGNKNFYLEDASKIIAEINAELLNIKKKKNKADYPNAVKSIQETVLPQLLTTEFDSDILDPEYLKISNAAKEAIELLKLIKN